MKTIRNLLIGMVITGSLAASLHFLHAQETATSAASQQEVNSLSDTEVLLQTIESVPPAPASIAPQQEAHFARCSRPEPVRLAWLARRSKVLPLWNLGDGIYLLDDLQVDYSMSSSMAGGMMSQTVLGYPAAAPMVAPHLRPQPAGPILPMISGFKWTARPTRQCI